MQELSSKKESSPVTPDLEKKLNELKREVEKQEKSAGSMKKVQPCKMKMRLWTRSSGDVGQHFEMWSEWHENGVDYEETEGNGGTDDW